MKNTILALAAAVALSGCATQTGVISTGPGTYMVLKQGNGFWTAPSTLNADVIQEASQYCANQSKALKIINTRQAGVGFRPGAYPEAEIEFSCI